MCLRFSFLEQSELFTEKQNFGEQSCARSEYQSKNCEQFLSYKWLSFQRLSTTNGVFAEHSRPHASVRFACYDFGASDRAENSIPNALGSPTIASARARTQGDDAPDEASHFDSQSANCGPNSFRRSTAAAFPSSS
jgi:hypothetical protein